MPRLFCVVVLGEDIVDDEAGFGFGGGCIGMDLELDGWCYVVVVGL